MMIKKLTTFVALALIFAVAFLSGGCDKRSPMESVQKDQSNELARGTFTADKTASGFYERQVQYKWCGGKTVTPDSMIIEEGECAQASYTLIASKILESDAVVYGVRGEICVHNNTDQPTTNLGIQDVVRYRIGGGTWQGLVADSIDISAKPVLAPGESFCYPYEVIFQPKIGAEYKNTAYIRNGVSIIATVPVSFTLPDTQTLSEIDGEAQITDAVFCPDGFTFSTGDPGPWYLTASDTITYTMQICNQSAACNNIFSFTNIASLEKMTTHEIVADTATVAIFTGECVDCGECDGGVTQLTLRYNGSHDAHIKVYQGRKPKPRMMIFDGNVAPNGTFTFNGTKEGGTMGGIISIYEGSHLKTIFHTSCEKPIGPGLVRGNFEVISGYSREGGLLCPELPTPPEGCTRTIGYWKNHPEVIIPLLPIWLGNEGGLESMEVVNVGMAVNILRMKVYGNQSNGITKLYAQMLASKLNIANGADGSDIADTIVDADNLLADHNWEDWGAMDEETRQMVLDWKDIFDAYNNGDIGPGHCGD